MPTINFQGKDITCERGENMRRVLLKANAALYNGKAKYINCMGIGTCGTCAVEIEGHGGDRNWKETGRLSLPPHSLKQSRRLACQIQVMNDIKVTKFEGFWGQGESEADVSPQ